MDARTDVDGLRAETAARFFLSHSAISEEAVKLVLADVQVFLRDVDEARVIDYKDDADRATWLRFMDRRADRLLERIGVDCYA